MISTIIIAISGITILILWLTGVLFKNTSSSSVNNPDSYQIDPRFEGYTDPDWWTTIQIDGNDLAKLKKADNLQDLTNEKFKDDITKLMEATSVADFRQLFNADNSYKLFLEGIISKKIKYHTLDFSIHVITYTIYEYFVTLANNAGNTPGVFRQYNVVADCGNSKVCNNHTFQKVEVTLEPPGGGDITTYTFHKNQLQQYDEQIQSSYTAMLVMMSG